ncbi:glycogen synthase [Pontiella sulfatireligans]|uniref:starch synthase n=1 Tax=Pontiella sulfatireligans TaxID=2750658 RepID=A0A6C2UHZ2_9BACT|nr:glycogen/starch synthase [Pontiella sulfatireligans]VGO19832.1 Glycogen synthase [Pontiella sulfatireligans]
MAGKTKKKQKSPRILIVTPEITYLPSGMGNMTNKLSAKAGGLADVSASLVSALYELGADVHVALPHYRKMFHVDIGGFIDDELLIYKSKLPDDRIHLAEDRIFYYQDHVYSNSQETDLKIALAFQREVINNIIPTVKPDLIHCNDWMTGLIPGEARMLGIPSLFTFHNIHTVKTTLAHIEDRGIDAAEFWSNLYYEWPSANYFEARENNPVDFLCSGIFSSHFINTVSPTFMKEIVDNQHSFVPANIQWEVASKYHAGCGTGILNSPDASCDPETDEYLIERYGAADHFAAKRKNKVFLQERLGLEINPDAPMLFWPSRLDPVQKGCQLVSDILFKTIDKYRNENLQFVFIANGAYQQVFHDIVYQHDLYSRVGVCDFEEGLSHIGFAASDFMLIPSLFEPCGLPQMTSAIYGSLPIARDTGGLHDSVIQMDVENGTGNGFLFENYDGDGLAWAIDQAMEFYRLDEHTRGTHVGRIMTESKKRFNHEVTAQAYIDIYQQMLHRPLVDEVFEKVN